ncbi:MAG: hypothetical protein ABMB14_33945 [Myxococcota bacterium]
MNVDLYRGFEGEPAIVFSSAGGTIHCWSGYFDRLMEAVMPAATGWVGFARHYHLLTGWREEPRWVDPDPQDTLRQLERTKDLDGGAQGLKDALVALYRAAIMEGGTVTFMEE